MLRRLEVGLIDEGVTVARAAPRGGPAEPAAGLAANLTYSTGGVRWLSISPSRQLLDALKTVTPFKSSDAKGPLDIVHAWGTGAWPIAIELVQHTGAAVALEVWSRDAIERIPHIEHRTHDLEAAGSTGLWLAPDRATLAALGETAHRWRVELSDWGIHPSTLRRADDSQGRPQSVCIMSSGKDQEACTNCLSGLARAVRERDDVLVFLDEAAVRPSRAIWKHAEDLGLAPIMSVTPSVESRRDPVLRADVLIQPEARGEHRTLVLEAMAAGATVVAPPDPLIECLDDERSVKVGEPNVTGWEQALRTVLDDVDLRQRLCANARAYAKANRLVHQQIAATLGAYESLLADEPISFASESR